MARRLIFILMFLVSLSILNTRAEADVVVGPQINIYVGPDGQQEQAAAYDPINRRFLVVWGDYSLPDTNVYGQLVNEDGSLYAGRIAICEAASGQSGPYAAFDPVNQRFLVAWGDARIVGEQTYETYGQFVNNDGSLWGDNFVISPVPPDEYKREGPVGVVFEPNFNRFLVLMLDASAGGPYNLYGRFVNANGALGDFFPITNFISGYGVWQQKIGYDSNNSRFLIAYGNPYGGSGSDGSIYGRLLNADGTFFSEEFIISDTGVPGGSNFISSISFDPFNNRFLAVFGRAWWMHIIEGQLINADGSLYAGVISINNYADDGRAVFDTANEKFLVAGQDGQSAGIFGQLLYPDGELFGSAFTVDPVIGWLQLCQGSSETGHLLTTSPSFAETGRDILGRIIKIVNRAPVLNPIGNKVVYVGNLLSFQVSGYDPDGDRVSLTATGLPEGASFVDNGDGTGIFSWTPSGSQIGPHQVTFRISDGNLSDEEVVTITVKSGGGCFLAGTPITMADGSKKAIEKIKLGDMVMAYDENDKTIKPGKVTNIFKHDKEDLYLVINKELRVTPIHRVLSKGEWIEIGKLKVGDALTDTDGKDMRIASIDEVKELVDIYNFEVNPLHTYVVNLGGKGIIVHNRKLNATMVDPGFPR